MERLKSCRGLDKKNAEKKNYFSEKRTKKPTQNFVTDACKAELQVQLKKKKPQVQVDATLMANK